MRRYAGMPKVSTCGGVMINRYTADMQCRKRGRMAADSPMRWSRCASVSRMAERLNAERCRRRRVCRQDGAGTRFFQPSALREWARHDQYEQANEREAGDIALPRLRPTTPRRNFLWETSEVATLAKRFANCYLCFKGAAQPSVQSTKGDRYTLGSIPAQPAKLHLLNLFIVHWCFDLERQ
jgi:hypothetical protein